MGAAAAGRATICIGASLICALAPDVVDPPRPPQGRAAPVLRHQRGRTATSPRPGPRALYAYFMTHHRGRLRAGARWFLADHLRWSAIFCSTSRSPHALAILDHPAPPAAAQAAAPADLIRAMLVVAATSRLLGTQSRRRPGADLAAGLCLVRRRCWSGAVSCCARSRRGAADPAPFCATARALGGHCQFLRLGARSLRLPSSCRCTAKRDRPRRPAPLPPGC